MNAKTAAGFAAFNVYAAVGLLVGSFSSHHIEPQYAFGAVNAYIAGWLLADWHESRTR